MSRSDIVSVIAILINETPKAILIDHGGKQNCWLPKSAIEFEKNKGGKTITIELEQSFAEEKEII
jgi:hypothetical protein